ncbi:MAG: hypothetical protein NW218_04170 [Saprospiraceae bacterium]|nr:hypothetical protein [Saprospiraceae bacterium]
MRVKTVLVFVIAFSLFSGFFSACTREDLEQVEISDHTAEFAFPLFSTDLLMKDLMLNILNDTLSGDTLYINSDNSMTLIYTGDVAEKKATDIFNFLENGLVPIADSVSSSPIQAPDGVTVTRADIKSGTITLIIYNNTPDTVSGIFEITQMSANGVVFNYPFTVPPTPSTVWISPPIDLSGNILLSGSNLLEFKYYAYNKDGVRIAFPPINGGFAPVFVSFQNLTFSYLQGYWGYSSYPLTRDTIEIDLNQTNLDGNVKVKNPKVTMKISNSWGFPTRGKIKYLSFIGKDGTEYKLNSTIFVDDAVDFEFPDFTKNEVGQTKYTYLKMDESNSNIAEIFNAQPTRLVYEVEGISNANLDPNVIGFLTDSSNIKLSVGVELLLEGSADNFQTDQTLDLDFGTYSALDTTEIEAVEFKLVTENQTAISAAVQIFFLDENENMVDSLFVGGPQFIMNAAPVNAQGIVSGVTRKENFIPMSIARFERVRTTKKAVLQAAFTTANGGQIPVKLLATDQVVIKMGLKVKTRL